MYVISMMMAASLHIHNLLCFTNAGWNADFPLYSCSCGAAKQTMSHIVNDCPLSRFPGGITTLHLASNGAIKWLGMQCKR